ncbi:hypothetical protein [Dyadobacter luticola]|uniref:Uncharacterized protein n=1 Tax=Dyadobacter luticola TaxID=1979387 RepID=A0A5R9L4C2_9BACT|nr:hypothetical protein [Dyadobacter luticola]TLV03434.1 hypothetical protein FEN17_07460 [Dyadobacter luticola]
MENEDLYCKIRELLDAPDEQQDWNPEKIWAMVEAKNQKRVTFSWTYYAAAAVLLFTFGYFVLNKTNSSGQIEAKEPIITQPETSQKTDKTFIAKRDSDMQVNMNNPEVFTGKKLKKKSCHKTYKLASNKHFRTLKKRSDLAAMNVALSQNDQDSPSLYQMYKQAQKERELRNLSVKLDDSEDYNRFWLAVNQHLLANKFSGRN